MGRVFAVVSVIVAASIACSAAEPTIEMPDASSDDAGKKPAKKAGSGDARDAPFADGARPDAALLACAKETVTATRVPLELVIMLDSSGSMAETITAGPSKWSAVTGALGDFFEASTSTGIAASLSFFPIPKPGTPASCVVGSQCGAAGPCTRRVCLQQGPMTYCDDDFDCSTGPCVDYGTCSNDRTQICLPSVPNAGCTGGVCNVGTAGECENGDSCAAPPYAAPVVASSSLPSAAANLVSAMSQRSLRGFTPMGPAVDGLLDQARSLAAAKPTHRVVALLVTDGLPTACSPQSASALANLVAGGLADGVATHVIGVFAPEEEAEARVALDALALAGGTQKALLASTSAGTSQRLKQALDAVRTQALPCSYTLPAPDSGTLDFEEVNVTRERGPSADTWPRVADASECANELAWHYDRPAAQGPPKAIELCPAACADAKSETSTKVDIVLGCKTLVK